MLIYLLEDLLKEAFKSKFLMSLFLQKQMFQGTYASKANEQLSCFKLLLLSFLLLL